MPWGPTPNKPFRSDPPQHGDSHHLPGSPSLRLVGHERWQISVPSQRFRTPADEKRLVELEHADTWRAIAQGPLSSETSVIAREASTVLSLTLELGPRFTRSPFMRPHGG
jgi:hypothetical protein